MGIPAHQAQEGEGDGADEEDQRVGEHQRHCQLVEDLGVCKAVLADLELEACGLSDHVGRHQPGEGITLAGVDAIWGGEEAADEEVEEGVALGISKDGDAGEADQADDGRSKEGEAEGARDQRDHLALDVEGPAGDGDQAPVLRVIKAADFDGAGGDGGELLGGLGEALRVAEVQPVQFDPERVFLGVHLLQPNLLEGVTAAVAALFGWVGESIGGSIAGNKLTTRGSKSTHEL